MQDNTEYLKTRYPSNFTPLGKIMWYSKAMKWYENADCLSFVWRWYHPLTWLAVPVLLFISFMIGGISGLKREGLVDLGLAIDPYFKKHPEEFRWFK